MPELPEVERGRTLADAAARKRRIVKVRCARDTIVFDGVTARAMSAALTGAVVTGVSRRGKHIWFQLDRRPWPCFHFGMTGEFRTPDLPHHPLAAGPRPDPSAWPPRFTKIHLHFDDGGELAMTNPRRLGRIRLRMDPAAEPPISRLGFDPLIDLPAAPVFIERLSQRRCPIKALLMDQSFAAGVGNWIADEVLYQARIDPRRPAHRLDDREAKAVRRALKHVVVRAVAVEADARRFPRGWLFHRRWGGPRKGAVTTAGLPIVHCKVAGRTTAWVPQRQR